MADYIYLANIM